MPIYRLSIIFLILSPTPNHVWSLHQDVKEAQVKHHEAMCLPIEDDINASWILFHGYSGERLTHSWLTISSCCAAVLPETRPSFSRRYPAGLTWPSACLKYTFLRVIDPHFLDFRRHVFVIVPGLFSAILMWGYHDRQGAIRAYPILILSTYPRTVFITIENPHQWKTDISSLSLSCVAPLASFDKDSINLDNSNVLHCKGYHEIVALSG